MIPFGLTLVKILGFDAWIKISRVLLDFPNDFKSRRSDETCNELLCRKSLPASLVIPRSLSASAMTPRSLPVSFIVPRYMSTNVKTDGKSFRLLMIIVGQPPVDSCPWYWCMISPEGSYRGGFHLVNCEHHQGGGVDGFRDFWGAQEGGTGSNRGSDSCFYASS
ncbi:hypothetical protein H5410_021112 [Solanum commersonii]|uniref:Uncharacterized protein n=1 Tax=Solanum commersonii TaxID=4109 RepID=A0A9J5ZD24_SOLCO|nr:hypothetical protein H5410_021112 [Solanum commersonii]